MEEAIVFGDGYCKQPLDIKSTENLTAEASYVRFNSVMTAQALHLLPESRPPK